MFKKLSIFAILMLCVPCGAWILGYKWGGIHNTNHAIDYPLYCITLSASSPYLFIVCVVFVLMLMLISVKKQSLLLVGILCIISVAGMQCIKSALKEAFKQPRPYVEYIFNEDSGAFYELSKKERKIIIEEFYQDEGERFMAAHHAKNTGYSFPSGHSMFAASWLLLCAGLLLYNKSLAAKIMQGFVCAWALLVLISRLRLGMHYPLDLFASIVIAWIFHIALFMWFMPYLDRKLQGLRLRLAKNPRFARFKDSLERRL